MLRILLITFNKHRRWQLIKRRFIRSSTRKPTNSLWTTRQEEVLNKLCDISSPKNTWNEIKLLCINDLISTTRTHIKFDWKIIYETTERRNVRDADSNDNGRIKRSEEKWKFLLLNNMQKQGGETTHEKEEKKRTSEVIFSYLRPYYERSRKKEALSLFWCRCFAN